MTDNPYASPNPEKSPVPPKWDLKIILLQVVVAAAVVSVLIALLLPNVRRAREPARRTQCKNNLKQIGLALHNYHEHYGVFPPAYTVDANGRRLHSWRTLILPFVDQVSLYNKIDLSKAWDDPVNAEAAKTWLGVYHCPAVEGPTNHSSYVAIVDPGSCFPGTTSKSLSEIKDGSSQTLVVLEVNKENAVPWMSPTDVDEQFLLNVGPKSKVTHAGGLYALFADGTVRFLSYNLKDSTRRALMTTDANDTVGEW